MEVICLKVCIYMHKGLHKIPKGCKHLPMRLNLVCLYLYINKYSNIYIFFNNYNLLDIYDISYQINIY